jgi:hypothetical protein
MVPFIFNGIFCPQVKIFLPEKDVSNLNNSNYVNLLQILSKKNFTHFLFPSSKLIRPGYQA